MATASFDLSPFKPAGLITKLSRGIKESTSKAGRFFKNFGQKLKSINIFGKFLAIIPLFTTLIGIFKNPIQFIILIISGLILAIIYVLYKITTFEPIIFISYFIWWFFVYVVYAILYTIVIGFVVFLICIVLGVIAIINYITKGALNNLVLCQNSPSSWYKVPNFHLGNKFERSLFCKSPCLTGYVADESTGEYCNKLPQGQPSFCPQAEIMRIYSGFNRKDKDHVYGDYTTFYNRLNSKTPKEQESDYKAYYLERQKFNKTCQDKLGSYNGLSLDICSHIDMLAKDKTSKLSSKDIKRLKEVCAQGFCNSKNTYSFCGNFSQESKDYSKGKQGLIKLIVQFIVLMTMFVMFVYLTYKYIQNGQLY